ncbi:hypothetical protein QF026_007342 [Streptomyces aurantiacus]|nr:hypothetical protein [Streptomyces aurantiacus]
MVCPAKRVRMPGFRGPSAMSSQGKSVTASRSSGTLPELREIRKEASAAVQGIRPERPPAGAAAIGRSGE